MKPWKFFGPGTKLTKVARLIMNEDVAGMAACLGKDWKLNQPFKFCEYVDDLAINLAIIEKKPKVIEYLLSKKVNLNVKGAPAITYAARNSSSATIEKLLAAGAKLDAENNVGSNAYSCALYSNRFDLLPFLLAKGLPIDADSGKSFRQAVFDGQHKAVEFFLKNGIDVNARVADMVHPEAPTALQVAVIADNLPMVDLLVAHGADPTLADNNGRRPYHCAMSKKIRTYLRAREPAALHDPRRQIANLKRHGVPDELIAFLQRNDRRVGTGKNRIQLRALTETYEFLWQRGRYIFLQDDVNDSYDGGILVWWPQKKCLAFIDEEHDEITKLGSWSALLADPAAAIAKQWEN